MNWNRFFLVIAGSPESHPKLVAAAGLFVVVWFTMDLVEFVDWTVGKLSNPSPVVCIGGPIKP